MGPATPRACYIFKCGDKLLETVDKYRYFGIVMNTFLDFNVTGKIVAQSASRALGALIYKVKINGGMQAIRYEKLLIMVRQSGVLKITVVSMRFLIELVGVILG